MKKITIEQLKIEVEDQLDDGIFSQVDFFSHTFQDPNWRLYWQIKNSIRNRIWYHLKMRVQ
jgi:hypothetical protein